MDFLAFVILALCVAPIAAGFLNYLDQRRTLAKRFKPDHISLKHRLDRE